MRVGATFVVGGAFAGVVAVAGDNAAFEGKPVPGSTMEVVSAAAPLDKGPEAAALIGQGASR